MSNSNPRITPVPINASGGAFTAIVLTMMASKVRVMEDPSYNAGVLQGLTGFYVDTQPGAGSLNVVTQRTWLPNGNGQTGPAYEPIEFGGEAGRVHGGEGDYVGAQGTIILQLTTNSVNAGGILLEEWA